MPLPVWVIAIRDPAYAYMLRSSGVRRPRTPLPWRRPKPFSQGYTRAGTRLPQLTDEEIAEFQRRPKPTLDATAPVWMTWSSGTAR